MKSVEAVSIIIPAFNEEGGVSDVVKQIRHVLIKAKIKHEKTVRNDGAWLCVRAGP